MRGNRAGHSIDRRADPRQNCPGHDRARPGRSRTSAPAQNTEFEGCTTFIADRKLQMELVDVEHLFGGERIVFYFLAEKRVDFRELVKDLAREYRTRIEMRQIGVRDEAKLLADYGDCGKPVCCNTHMAVMPPVSMRMAKLQKSTLDPSKISGPLRPAQVLPALRAGRLRGIPEGAAAARRRAS